MFYFVKSEWFKLVLALAILGSIVGLLLFAQYTAKVEEEKYAIEKKLHPTAEMVTIDNYELKEVDDFNHMKWRLQAKSAILEPVTKDVILTMVNVEYYDEGKVKMKVLAPKGVVNQDTKIVKLNSLPKLSVVAEGEEGKSRLETKSLELTKKNQFIATGGVNINMSGVAKVSGDKAEGVFGKSELQDVKITGNTHSIVGSDDPIPVDGTADATTADAGATSTSTTKSNTDNSNSTNSNSTNSSSTKTSSSKTSTIKTSSTKLSTEADKP